MCLIAFRRLKFYSSVTGSNIKTAITFTISQNARYSGNGIKSSSC